MMFNNIINRWKERKQIRLINQLKLEGYTNNEIDLLLGNKPAEPEPPKPEPEPEPVQQIKQPLTPRQKAILILNEQHYRQREISCMMNCSLGIVNSELKKIESLGYQIERQPKLGGKVNDR